MLTLSEMAAATFTWPRRQVASRAGFTATGRHLTPHALQHSYAIGVLAVDPECGVPPAPVPAVAALLGHSSIAVTGRYLKHFARRDLARFAPCLKQTTEHDD